jgi:hypothetical protein
MSTGHAGFSSDASFAFDPDSKNHFGGQCTGLGPDWPHKSRQNNFAFPRLSAAMEKQKPNPHDGIPEQQFLESRRSAPDAKGMWRKAQTGEGREKPALPIAFGLYAHPSVHEK